MYLYIVVFLDGTIRTKKFYYVRYFCVEIGTKLLIFIHLKIVLNVYNSIISIYLTLPIFHHETPSSTLTMHSTQQKYILLYLLYDPISLHIAHTKISDNKRLHFIKLLIVAQCYWIFVKAMQ